MIKDDDALWAAFPSSDVDDEEPIATQPSFNLSGAESHDTSMTSIASSSSRTSLKRKRDGVLLTVTEDAAQPTVSPKEAVGCSWVTP